MLVDKTGGRPVQELLPPASKQQSSAASQDGESQRALTARLESDQSTKSLLPRSKYRKGGLDVGNRLFALGKVYEAKKEI